MKKNWKIRVRGEKETFNVTSDRQFVYIEWKTGKGDPLWLNYTHNIYNHKVDMGDWIEIRNDTPPPKSNNLFSLDDV